MGCINTITARGDNELDIAIGILGPQRAEAISVKYSKDGVFDGFAKTINGFDNKLYQYLSNKESSSFAAQVITQIEGLGFTQQFGNWSVPIDAKEAYKLIGVHKDIQDYKYGFINDYGFSYPTTELMYRSVENHLNKGYKLGFLDSSNQLTSIPTSKPVFIEPNGNLVDIYGNSIENFNDYKLVNHKVNEQGYPLIKSDNIGYYATTQQGRLYVKKHNKIRLGKQGVSNVTVNITGSVTPAINSAEKQFEKLSKVFAKHGIKATLIADTELQGKSHISKTDDEVTIIYNPNTVSTDSIFHEFGHLYVELITETGFIEAGVAQLKDTKIWKRVQKLYPHYSGTKLANEVLTTAIGEYARDMDKSPIRFWLTRLFDRVAKLFGISQNVARQLAIDLTKGNLSKKIDYRIDMQDQWQLDGKRAVAFNTAQKFLSDKIEPLKRLQHNAKNKINNQKFKLTTDELIKKLEGYLDDKNSYSSLSQIEAVLSVTEYDLTWISKLEDKINNLTEKYVNNTSVHDMDKYSITALSKDIEAIQLHIDSYVHIENLEEFDKDIIKGLLTVKTIEGTAGVTKVYTPREILEGEDKQLAEVLAQLSNIRVNMASRINSAKQRTQKLITFQGASVVAQSSNSKTAREALDVFENGLTDENWWQKLFMNNFDSTNAYIANLEKVNRRFQRQFEHKRIQMLREFEEVMAKTKGVNVKSLYTLDNGELDTKLVSEYRHDDFYKDLKTIKDKSNSTEEYEENIKEIADRINDSEIPKIIEDKKKEISSNFTQEEYDRWLYDNFKYNLEENTYSAKLFGEFYKPKAKYKSSNYARIHSDKNSKEAILYDYILKTQKELTKHTEGLIQYHGGLPIIELKKTEKNGKKEYTILTDEKGREIHNINFRNVGNDMLVKYINYPKRDLKLQSEEEYEKSTVEMINMRYGKSFKSIKEIDEYNMNIKEENKKILKDAADYNIENIFPKFIKSSLEHQYKTTVEANYLVGIRALENSTMKRKNSAGDYIKNVGRRLKSGENEDANMRGIESNVLSRFRLDMEMKLYGKFLKESKYNSLLLGARNYVALLGLGFNAHAAAKNVVMGKAQILLEAKAGIHFNINDLKKAELEYAANVTHMWADRNNEVKASSKISGIVKMIKPIEDYADVVEQSHNLDVQRESQSKTKTILNKSWNLFNQGAFSLTTLAEHGLHTKPLLAMLHSHRLIDGKVVSRFNYRNENVEQVDVKRIKDKEYVRSTIKKNKQFKKNANKTFEETGIALIDVFDFKDGYITIKNDESGKPLLTDEQLSDFELKVQGVNHKLHGIYNKEDKGIIENNIIGQLAMQFKHWLPAMWQERFGASGNPFNTETTWNERRQEESIGNYNALWKMIGKATTSRLEDARDEKGIIPIQDQILAYIKGVISFITHARIYYHTMNEYEKAALMKAINEILMGLGAIALVAAISAAVPDEDKDTIAYNFPIYVLQGVRNELLGLTPGYGWVKEGLKIKDNPLATFGYTLEAIKLLGRVIQYPVLSDEDRVFKAGINKGRNKVYDSILKVTPFANQIDRFIKMQNKNQNKNYSVFSF